MSRRRRRLARGACLGVAAILTSVLAAPASATPYNVGLSASATNAPPGMPVVLTAQANIDVAGTPYYIEIYDTTAGQRVASCNSGRTCSAVVDQFVETTRTYVAVIDGFSAGYPPSNVVATSNAVTVRWTYVVSPPAPVGAVAFTGTASLPRFPCPPPPPWGAGPCTGTLSGTTHGHLAGTVGLDVFDVSWEGASGSGLAASFYYSEWDCDGTENALGNAYGSGTASVTGPDVFGFYRVAGEQSSRAVLGVSGRFTFDWVREGATAAISFRSFDVYLTVAGLGDRLVVTGGRFAAAAFAIRDAGLTGVPTCDQPMTNVEGEVAGTVPIT